MNQETLDRLGLVRLDVALPPMLVAALGYSGRARYLALYFDAEIGEPRMDDGQSDWEALYDAWGVLVVYAFRNGKRAAYELGGPGPAEHFLLLDRQGEAQGQGALYAGDIEMISATVRPDGVPLDETAAPVRGAAPGEENKALVFELIKWLGEQLQGEEES